MSDYRIAAHAVERWRERVRPTTSAAEEIAEMARRGRRTEKAPRWLRDGGVRGGPGTVFICWHRRPGVALLVKQQRVITVLTREAGEPFREEGRTRRRADNRSRTGRRRLDS